MTTTKTTNTTDATGPTDAMDVMETVNAMKVTRGNPSEEELAAVLTVLLALGQGRDEAIQDAPTPARASWGGRIRGFGAPAGSWRAAS
ncbi:acyl-CoA carboxylase subunit epsilon [Streptomyces sp. NPDC002073]|uniref:acyl-CoA carboxylase subunit epsilon n=1 Tax=Streptomyces sp. NBC_00239 TaxID=2903640 RepID=UPI002E2C4EC9|nr:acyl-CoA carboxylase subunit epsilon [Streptomyces sp. NBC_00239]